jgi:hypothetical protein
MNVAVNTESPLTSAVCEAGGGCRIIAVNASDRRTDIMAAIHGLIGEAWSHHASTIAIPVTCMPLEFFQPRTGLAGAVLRKLANYRLTVAFVGAVPDPFLGSFALRDLIRECNRGRSVWFVDNMDELIERLAIRNY